MELRTVPPALLALAALTLTLALAPTSADAAPATVWAAPDGTGDLCSQTEPCAVDVALRVAADGTEVVLGPGRYEVSSLSVVKAVDLHGPAGATRPVIVTTGLGIGVYVGAPAVLHDLDVESAVSGGTLYLAGSGARVERAGVTSTRTAGTACTAVATSLVRDSVCWAPQGIGFGANLSGGSGTTTVRLRNVTAVGGRYGIGYDAGGSRTSATFDIDARNVVARGGSVDVRALAGDRTVVRVALDHSSFATRDTLATGTDSTATVTEPGTGANQVAAPLFVDAEHGDLRQQPGSPTVDAGADDPDLGTTDPDGDARALPATAAACPGLPDIGADELAVGVDCAPAPAPAPAPATAAAPETRLLSGPPHRVRARGHRARVRLTFTGERAARFECALDRAAYAPCGSPLTLRLRPGRHTVAVRAVSATGAVDPTPVALRLRVRR